MATAHSDAEVGRKAILNMLSSGTLKSGKRSQPSIPLHNCINDARYIRVFLVISRFDSDNFQLACIAAD